MWLEVKFLPVVAAVVLAAPPKENPDEKIIRKKLVNYFKQEVPFLKEREGMISFSFNIVPI